MTRNFGMSHSAGIGGETTGRALLARRGTREHEFYSSDGVAVASLPVIGDRYARGSPATLKSGSPSEALSSPHHLAFSEPLEAIRLSDPPLDIRRAFVALIFMGVLSATFIELAFVADFVSSFVKFP